LTNSAANHWGGMFSYTYSKFRGNYTGLTSTDIGDAGGGRNSPNNSRAFDEPFFSWDAAGQSSSGLLPTDRPNTFKGYGYYELNWLKKFTSDFGLFQTAYEGTPQTLIIDVGQSFASSGFVAGGAFPTYVVGRGKWANVTQDPTTGAISVGPTETYRTPWYNQTDFNFQQSYKVAEAKTLSFSATIGNIFNQRSVTADWPFTETTFFPQWQAPQGLSLYGASSPAQAVQTYRAYEAPYNWVGLLNSMAGVTPCISACGTSSAVSSGVATINSVLGKPYIYQLSRTVRLGIKFTF